MPETTRELMARFTRPASYGKNATELRLTHATLARDDGGASQFVEISLKEREPTGKYRDVAYLTIRSGEVQAVIDVLIKFAGNVLTSDSERKPRSLASTERKPARALATTAVDKPQSWQQLADDDSAPF